MSAAAIKRRLLALREKLNQPYNLLLTRYAQDRILYRLSVSPHRSKFFMKGGMLITSLTDTPSRATTDIDFGGNFPNDVDTVKTIMMTVLETAVEPDGLVMLPEEMTFAEIRQEAKYAGTRCIVPIMFGNERKEIQIDIGFGDRVYQPVEFDFPILIEGVPQARLLTYSVESVIAEKFEAMAALGNYNTRSKDFADVVSLVRGREFLASSLWTAADITFRTRGTEISALADAIADDIVDDERERLYTLFLKRTHAGDAPTSLAACLPIIRAFLDGAMQFSRSGIEQVWNRTTLTWGPVQ